MSVICKNVEYQKQQSCFVLDSSTENDCVNVPPCQNLQLPGTMYEVGFAVVRVRAINTQELSNS